jgi:hypothetical protein
MPTPSFPVPVPFFMRRVSMTRALALSVVAVFAFGLIGLIGLVPLGTARAQSAAGEQATIESRYVVDMPMAGVLPRGRFAAEVCALGNSGVMFDLSFGVLPNFNVGLSYAGAGFLGSSQVVFQGLPGVHLRWRVVDETFSLPAVLVGFQTQGRGEPLGGNRFQTNSPGLYVTASKNFSILGSLALHAGVGYSFDTHFTAIAGERSPNVWIGLEKTIGSVVSLTAEYNPAFDNFLSMERRGLLNAGLRVATGKGFTFELQMRDVLRNLRGAQQPYRVIRMEFVGAF